MYLKERYAWADEDLVQDRLHSHLIPIKELKNGGYDGLGKEAKSEKIIKDYEDFLFKRAMYVEVAAKKLVSGRDINAKEIIKEVEEV